MKKLLLIAGVAILAMVACNKQEESKDTSDGQQPNMDERLSVAEDAKDSLIFVMSDIYSGLEEINMQENMMYNLRGTENAAQREEALANLSAIKNRLAERQATLEALAAQIDSEKANGQALLAEVNRLKTLITEKTKTIAELETKLQDANTQISNLKDTVAVTRQQVTDVTAEKELAQQIVDEQSQVIAQQQADANKVYYYIGTKKELEKAGLMVKKKANYSNLNIFTSGDKTQIKSIPLGNKKFEFVGAAPAASSYQVVGDKKAPKTLVITNPDLFWANKYLIIKID
ncbi:MAG: hypothetical protein NC548_64125 [Lachnospiraceae bacterium]|nr:hypothetical protein [Prevotella sp.]MCM1075330.1 hypothetical protein [Ruminococcus sp.]MCM1225378.1 hypothetical protein [Lachnospiraceae bacterium]